MSRSRFALLAVLYALVMTYASTVIGIQGPHFVALDPSEALDRLLNIPYVQNGSDQRSDWMGNLLMLVPLGFLVTGWFSFGRRTSGWSAISAFILCLMFILLVKYAQVFFPPRTVTLNYVIAQCLGTAAGILLFVVVHGPLVEIGHGMSRLETLRLILRFYTGLLILFLLMPLDFALSLEDIAAQLDKLPDTFTAIGGEGRPLVVRIAVAIGSILAMGPVGAMLTIVGRGRVNVGRSTGGATWIGFAVMVGVYALTTLLISGSASLPTVGIRTIGIAFGAWTMHALTRQNPDQIKRELGRLVPWVVPFYLVTLAAVNGLLSFEWATPTEAAASFHAYSIIPLYDYYIVTKPQAAKNIIAHIVMYAPVGIMIWLRAKQEGSRTAAFFLAAALSAMVEVGRFLRPGLVPDINAIPLAGAAAWAALAMMPLLWRTLSAVSIGGVVPVPLQSRPGTAGTRTLVTPARDPSPVSWRDRDIARRSRRRSPKNSASGEPIGEIEDY